MILDFRELEPLFKLAGIDHWSLLDFLHFSPELKTAESALGLDSGSFVVNSYYQIVVLGASLLLIGMLLVVSHILPRCCLCGKSKLKRRAERIRHFFFFGWFIRWVYLVFLSILLNAVAEIWLTAKGIKNIGSFLFAGIAILLLLGFLMILPIRIKMTNMVQKVRIRGLFKLFFESFKKPTNLNSAYWAVFIARRVSFVCLAVCLNDHHKNL